MSVYNNLPLLAYGRGSTTTGSPRVGAASVFSAQLLSGSDAFTPVIVTARSGTTPSVQLVVGDSGSPLLHGWTNPNGQSELTVLGLNSAVTEDNLYNVMSLLAAPGAMGNATDTMASTGYALRVQGNVAATWTGAFNSSLWIAPNWTGSPLDQYAEFRADGTTPTTITVDNAAFIRGLYFTEATGASQGFTFSGPQTLFIGRGGLTNYASLRQTVSNTIALADSQYWDVGPGGVTAANITTNDWLLEIAGSGTARITGAVSGNGGLALSGHRLELTGSSSYTGGTWVHGGTLVVNGTIAASSGVSLDAGAVLAGSGRVSGISGAGSVGPGNSPGILTATSVNPTGGLDFSFEFGKTGAPIWATGMASGNDLLRLTNPSSPFTSSLGGSNAIDVYLAATTLAFGDTFQGGLFTDASGDFLASIQNASFTYYVLGNGLGTAKTYNGQGYYLLDTTFWPAFEEVVLSTVSVASANFADGTVTNGRVMQIMMVPEPSAIFLVVVGAGIAMTYKHARRRA